MAIIDKHVKPALSPEWQSDVTVASASTGAVGTTGFTSCTYAGTQALTLADGHYNGQMVVVYAATAHTKTVTPASILGNSSALPILSKSCVIFIWYNDGTTSGWAMVLGAAGS